MFKKSWPSLAKAKAEHHQVKVKTSEVSPSACRFACALACCAHRYICLEKNRMSQEPLVDQEIIFEVLENQLADNNPKQVKETLMRLCMTGHSREDALELMACALAPEMEAVIERNETFNLQRYIEHLALLPEMPWVTE